MTKPMKLKLYDQYFTIRQLTMIYPIKISMLSGRINRFKGIHGRLPEDEELEKMLDPKKLKTGGRRYNYSKFVGDSHSTQEDIDFMKEFEKKYLGKSIDDIIDEGKGSGINRFRHGVGGVKIDYEK